nr:hypothetical protein [uncultured Pseudomonas sp.]
MHINSPSHSPFLAHDTERSDGESFRTAHGSMRADGESVPSNGESFRTTHGSFRSEVGGAAGASTSAVAVVTGVEDPANSPNAHALREKLTRFFEPHVTEQNRGAFTQLIEQRATRLNEMGETPQSIEATLAKGQMLDRVSRPLAGFVNSIPYGAASAKLSTIPALSPDHKVLSSFTGGVFGGAMDKVAGGTGLLKNATSDTLWLSAKPDELEPVMADAAKAREPSLARKAGEAALTIQTFSLMGVAHTALVPAALKMTEKAAAAMTTTINVAGTPILGAASSSAQHHINESNHRVGPEYLLGKQDWEASYTALKNYSARDAMTNLGKRTAQLPVDIATNGLQAIRDFGNAGSLLQNVGGLGGGYALTTLAREGIKKQAEKHGLGDLATGLIDKTAATIGNAASFAAWSAASVAGDTLADRASSFIRDNAANYLHGRPAGSQPVPTEPHDDGLEMTAQGLQPPQNAAGHAPTASTTNDHVVLDIVEEEPHPTGTEQPSHPLNNAERNV